MHRPERNARDSNKIGKEETRNRMQNYIVALSRSVVYSKQMETSANDA